jgi:hypothetical protein
MAGSVGQAKPGTATKSNTGLSTKDLHDLQIASSTTGTVAGRVVVATVDL